MMLTERLCYVSKLLPHFFCGIGKYINGLYLFYRIKGKCIIIYCPQALKGQMDEKTINANQAHMSIKLRNYNSLFAFTWSSCFILTSFICEMNYIPLHLSITLPLGLWLRALGTDTFCFSFFLGSLRPGFLPPPHPSLIPTSLPPLLLCPLFSLFLAPFLASCCPRSLSHFLLSSCYPESMC